MIESANSYYFGKNEHPYFVYIASLFVCNIIHIVVVNLAYTLINQKGTTYAICYNIWCQTNPLTTTHTYHIPVILTVEFIGKLLV